MQDSLWGIMNWDLDILVLPQFEEIAAFKAYGKAQKLPLPPSVQPYKKQPDDIDGSFLRFFKWPVLNSFHPTQKEGKWGVIDFKGSILIEFKYDFDQIQSFHKWIYVFSPDGKSLEIMVDSESRKLIPVPQKLMPYVFREFSGNEVPQRTYAFPFSYKNDIWLAGDATTGNNYVYNDSGAILFENDFYKPPGTGPLQVTQGQHHTVILRDGTILSNPTTDTFRSPGHQYYAYKREKGFQIYRGDASLLLDDYFEEVFFHDENGNSLAPLIHVLQNGRSGFISFSGRKFFQDE